MFESAWSGAEPAHGTDDRHPARAATDAGERPQMEETMSKKIDKELERLADARLPELRAKYEEVLGESTRAPNKTYLLRRIREGLEAKELTQTTASKPTGKKSSDGDTGAGRSSDGLTKLTVEELQERYRRGVGRDTGSSDKGYLIWKIRMARKGKVRVGPARERKHDPGTTQVVPLTLQRESVTALDEAVEGTSFDNRSAFLRRAIHDLLKHQGFAKVATRHFGDA